MWFYVSFKALRWWQCGAANLALKRFHAHMHHVELQLLLIQEVLQYRRGLQCRVDGPGEASASDGMVLVCCGDDRNTGACETGVVGVTGCSGVYAPKNTGIGIGIDMTGICICIDAWTGFDSANSLFAALACRKNRFSDSRLDIFFCK